MNLLTLVFIAISLAMDAFTVAIAKGISLKTVTAKQAMKVALFFGGFQALMPFIGWACGRSFAQYIQAFTSWISLILLCFIGGKMVIEAFKKDEDEEVDNDPLNTKSLILLAVATSIDALAVGVTFAFFEVNIIWAISLIGGITFVISYLGVLIGKSVGKYLKNYAEIIGGVILIIIGLSIFFSK